MSTKKGLQKFTKSQIKINKLLKLDRISLDDVELLSKTEIDQFSKQVTAMINEAKGIDRDKLYEKIESIIADDTKNCYWETNHLRITQAISILMKELGRMPSKIEIAEKTDLSRQTVHKHLNEYIKNPLYQEHLEQFRFMASVLLTKVYTSALGGDAGSAKLYFNVIGFLGGQGISHTLIQNQNYIQINNTILNQDTVKRLNPDQLNTIENILKTVQLQMDPKTIDMDNPTIHFKQLNK
jgi:hypothetical protein